ncbi:hypothetical protein DNX69_08450 [Rhodopseudomonas palustris]|uniref:Uncharacterized protein n=2 Tax=Rhodopseudomonas palustris TaxID=1076 RepID=A0A323UWH5_RHOPL|nr:hypothetical protein DNX69_08450 [Rhodopseudomonas palustris]
MALIRRFAAHDATAVANLFQAVFRRSKVPAPASLADYFIDIYLNHPWFDSEIGALVYVDGDQQVRGFIGINVVPMVWLGRPIRAAYAGSLMVDAPESDPLAGARLLRAYLNGAQDISISETANVASFGMWRKLGGEMVVGRSYEWVRVLRPLSLAATAAARRLPLLTHVRGATSLLDVLTAKALPALPQLSPDAGRDVAPSELADVILQATAGYALRPAFDASVLAYLLAHAARKEDRGSPVARVVYDRRGDPIGGYLAHADRHGVLRVMQSFTPPAKADLVVDDMLATAQRIGASGVAGNTQPEMMPRLQALGCLYVLRYVTVVHARDPALRAAAHTADTFLNGLGGESWMRLLGGRFD